jgi:hypothetical protein
MAELGARTLILAYAVVTMPWAVLAAFIAHGCFVGMTSAPRLNDKERAAAAPAAAYRDGSFTRAWQAVVLFAVYWDFRLSRSVPLLHAWPCIAARLVEHFTFVGLLMAQGTLTTSSSALRLWIGLTLAALALAAPVNKTHWSGRARLLQVTTNPPPPPPPPHTHTHFAFGFTDIVIW